jgi:hypothetical protein
MVERVEALSPVLPPLLVETKASYGILSAGIHALEEDACLRYFPVLRAAILLILEQDRRDEEKRQAEENLRAEIANITRQIGT